MHFKPPSELYFVRSEKPMSTVEIDLDSLNLSTPHGYAEIVESALRPLAAVDPTLCASIWIYQGVSYNFMKAGYSAFFAVPSRQSVLKALTKAFEAVPLLLVRYSDPIMQEQSVCQFHIQEGQVWREYEPNVWCAGQPEEDDDETCVNRAGEEMLPVNEDATLGHIFEAGQDAQEARPRSDSELEDQSARPARRPHQKGRTQRARSDASLGSLSRSIEALFGLPEGSVALRGPDRKVLRKDATVGTLRSRWE